MNLLTPSRIDIPELLDEHTAPPKDVDRSLRDLRRINRWLGGVAIYRRLLKRLAGERALVAVLDIGTATSDLLESIAEVPLRIGLDLKIDHLLFARHGSRVVRVVGDAARLPFRDGSVDVVTSAHFFHHFSPEDNTTMLCESLRVARRGVAVNDTQRHRVPLVFVRILGALRLVGRITRFDAPASVLRGYTIDEARRIAERTAASRCVVVPEFPFRLAILLWK